MAKVKVSLEVERLFSTWNGEVNFEVGIPKSTWKFEVNLEVGRVKIGMKVGSSGLGQTQHSRFSKTSVGRDRSSVFEEKSKHKLDFCSPRSDAAKQIPRSLAQAACTVVMGVGFFIFCVTWQLVWSTSVN